MRGHQLYPMQAAADGTSDDEHAQSTDNWWIIFAWVMFGLWVIGLILMAVNQYMLHIIARNTSRKYGTAPNPGWHDAVTYYESWTPGERGRMQTLAGVSTGLWMLPGVNMILNAWLMGSYLDPVHSKVVSGPAGYRFDEQLAQKLANEGQNADAITADELRAAEGAAANSASAIQAAARVDPSVTAAPSAAPLQQYGWPENARPFRFQQ